MGITQGRTLTCRADRLFRIMLSLLCLRQKTTAKKTVMLIVSGARTPITSFVDTLKNVSATELGAVAARGAFAKTGVDPAWIDQAVVAATRKTPGSSSASEMGQIVFDPQLSPGVLHQRLDHLLACQRVLPVEPQTPELCLCRAPPDSGIGLPQVLRDQSSPVSELVFGVPECAHRAALMTASPSPNTS